MMKIIGFFTFISLCVYSQDEGTYKELFHKEKESITKSKEKFKLEVRSKRYRLDLNSDKKDEFLELAKKDGVDFFYIYAHDGKPIYKLRFNASGLRSSLFKVQLKELSKKSKLLVLFYNEGHIKTENFIKTARVYFLTIDNNDLSKIYTYKGPSIFMENDQKFLGYSTRRYALNLYDYDLDGTKEVSISHFATNRVFFYKGEGVWGYY